MRLSDGATPNRVDNFVSYIYVDKDLMLKLAETGLDVNRVDDIREIINGNNTKAFPFEGMLDILEAYDELVMEIAYRISEDNKHLIEAEIREAEQKQLGFVPPIRDDVIEGEEPGEEETPEEESEREGTDIVDTQITRSGAKKKAISKGQHISIYRPGTINVFHKRTGRTTKRYKAVAWRKRGATKLSSQEQYLYSRKDDDVETVKLGMIQKFGIHRTKMSLTTKLRRLTGRISLTDKEREEESGGGVMGP